METVGQIIVICGFAVWIAGQIWLSVRAFRCSMFWGFAVLFIGVAGLAFIVGRWRYASTPFLVYVAGLVLMLIGGVILSQGSTVR